MKNIQKNITIINKSVDIQTEYLNLTFFGKIEKNEIQKIRQLEKLKHLNLSSSDLIDEQLEIIGKIENIQVLDLDLTEITNQGISFLKYLQNLKELRLKDNPQLSDNCIEHLITIKSLKFIHIENTAITIDGLKKLLCKSNLESIIIDAKFNNQLNKLIQISEQYPEIEIILKETGLILNGKIS
ncbi:hypothetical protein Fleli_1223 [Bernardetia litoralis DSM 6794]|uniref:Leucine Rich Repeat (LRR)-containing protein n=1 Tax=Bernardetia litoralis (strain ATCC 23117 / DSM 6794 / NBRC 15988 / NCIMB 1366 / Fx l1 / Sio-4) TaxID=880071 RepID=I4AI75_BERLS|nr:hypothetical protein [Bernardetia litoralis]AFM03660.1 hypothetical protein Fleli_1223 [Bernardetia litoralis DSM 6794]